MDFYEQKGLEKVKVIERCLEKKILRRVLHGQLASVSGRQPADCVCRYSCLKILEGFSNLMLRQNILYPPEM